MRAEKMYMMDVIGDLDYVDDALSDILNSECVELVSALPQIEDNTFALDISDEHLDKSVGFNDAKEFEIDESYKELRSMSDVIIEDLNLDLEEIFSKKLQKSYDPHSIRKIYEDLSEEIKKIENIKKDIANKEEVIEKFSHLIDLEIDFSKIKELEYFNYSFGLLNKEDSLKLKTNYEKLLAAIFHLGRRNEPRLKKDLDIDLGIRKEEYLILYPKKVNKEVERILKSLNWKELDIPDGYKGTPREVIERLNIEIENLKTEKDNIQKKIIEKKQSNIDDIEGIIQEVFRFENIEKAKLYLAQSEDYFYLTGWIGKSDVKNMKKLLSKYKDIFVQFKDSDEVVKLQPPTKLRNNKLFEPFELLVNMYGTPNYNELDPTPFLGFTYMLLFGAMFGDVGQGLVIFLLGLILSKKGRKDFGGLFERIGFSSAVFGFLYGSVFGMEDIIPALLIRPFENINTVLLSAIYLGIVLTVIAYGLGFYNIFLEKDLGEGLFGKKGIAGFTLYIMFLMLVLRIVKGKGLPMPVIITLMIISILLMIFKVPLTNLITHVRPLHKDIDISSYYIEESFSIVETVLSIFSGTVSFIRVGAFAINHVGLFMAFTTIGDMIGTKGGSIAMIIIGNIVITVLEGFIVSIQGIRLQYYELFSKYYKGDGIEFIPSKSLTK